MFIPKLGFSSKDSVSLYFEGEQKKHSVFTGKILVPDTLKSKTNYGLSFTQQLEVSFLGEEKVSNDAWEIKIKVQPSNSCMEYVGAGPIKSYLKGIFSLKNTPNIKLSKNEVLFNLYPVRIFLPFDSISVCNNGKTSDLDCDVSPLGGQIEWFSGAGVEIIGTNVGNSIDARIKPNIAVGYAQVIYTIGGISVSKIIRIKPLIPYNRISNKDTFEAIPNKINRLVIENMPRGGRYSIIGKPPFSIIGVEFSPSFQVKPLIKNISGYYPVTFSYKVCDVSTTKKVVIAVKLPIIKVPKLIHIYPNEISSITAELNPSVGTSIVWTLSPGLINFPPKTGKTLKFKNLPLIGDSAIEYIKITAKSGFYTDTARIKVFIHKRPILQKNIPDTLLLPTLSSYTYSPKVYPEGGKYLWFSNDLEINPVGQNPQKKTNQVKVTVLRGMHSLKMYYIIGKDSLVKTFYINGYGEDKISCELPEIPRNFTNKDTLKINVLDKENVYFVYRNKVKKGKTTYFETIQEGYCPITEVTLKYIAQPDVDLKTVCQQGEEAFLEVFTLKGFPLSRKYEFNLLPGKIANQSHNYVCETKKSCSNYVEKESISQKIPKGNPDNMVNISLAINYNILSKVILEGESYCSIGTDGPSSTIIPGNQGKIWELNKQESEKWALKIRRNVAKDKTIKLARKSRECQLKWLHRVDVEFDTGLKSYFNVGTGQGKFVEAEILKVVTPP